VTTLTMSAAIEGRLLLHPWLTARLNERGDGVWDILGEDVFSLVIACSKSRGLASFSGHEPPSVRWGPNGAGGDWTQGKEPRRLAWLQCAVPEQPLSGRRLPIQPVFSVLHDVLSLVGVIELEAIQAIAPLAAAPDGRFDIAALSRCFDFVDPSGAREILLRLMLPDSTRAAPRALWELVRTLSGGRIAAEDANADSPHPVAPPYGTQWLLGDGTYAQTAARCTLPAWSVDAASWLIETVIEALRVVGCMDPVAISVMVDPRSPT